MAVRVTKHGFWSKGVDNDFSCWGRTCKVKVIVQTAKHFRIDAVIMTSVGGSLTSGLEHCKASSIFSDLFR